MSGGEGHQGRQRKQRQGERQREWRAIGSNELHQMAITGATMSHPTEAWGDRLMAKQDGICWIGLLNPSGFTLQGESAKDDQLRNLMKEMEVDVMCFPKVNVCWHSKLMPHNRLEERTIGWFEMLHQLVAYNYHDHEATQHQYGGTLILGVNNAACRVMDSEHDMTGLGWWMSTWFRG